MTTVTRETEKTYATEDWKTFVLREPDTFLGSGALDVFYEFTYHPPTRMVRQEAIYASHAMKHTFTEALSNAQDAIMRAKTEGLPASKVDVVFREGRRIEITNVGADIISVRRNEAGVWIPESVLGNLLSGSNSRAKNKTWVGKNGVGGTLVNIFSSYFCVEVWDHVRRVFYRQEWRDNCVKCTDEPLLVEGGKDHFAGYEGIPDDCGAVRVVFDLDFPKFCDAGLSERLPDIAFLRGCYTDPVLRLYARKVLDCSLATRVPVHLLWTSPEGEIVVDETFEVDGIQSYSERFFEEKPANCLVYRAAFPSGWKPAQSEGVLSELEAVIYDTPDEGYAVSFANGQPTEMGGVHVDELCKGISRYAIKLVEDANTARDKTNTAKLVQADVMNHVTVFVSAVVPDPKFSGQTKSRLTAPRPAVRWFESDIEKVKDWSMVRAVTDTLDMKRKRLLSKTDGRKTRRINIPKAEDANHAGGPESERCVLWFCEGDSAKNYALTLLENLDGGRDFNGIYPLSGKILNVMKANSEQLSRNRQVIEIKLMLGLQEGVDYSLPENIRQLRYGKIGVLTDQDMDGNHIKYLLTVFFGTRFSGILVRGNMITWLSPIIRVKKGKTSIRFFSMGDFHAWKADKSLSEIKKWSVKYYKGLGGSTDVEVQEDVTHPFVEVTRFDEHAMDTLKLAFDRDHILQRKAWIQDHIREKRNREVREGGRTMEGIPEGYEETDATLGEFLNRMDRSRRSGDAGPLMLEYKTISRGIREDYMNFNLLSLKRAIPCEIDGLKVSERKVVWTALKVLKEHEEIKTAQFGNMTAKETDYAHNEQCLERVISGLAQDFPTSNNMPYFKGNGQFGSQYRPKASAGRYTHVERAFWLRYVFREEDDAILPMVFDEGRETEPEHLMPIIPMLLVNGGCGIANGFSSFVPQYNPVDVVREVRRIINGEPGDASYMNPWYRGFKGSIELLVEDDETQRVIAMQAYGCYEQKRHGVVRVTELPIGCSGEVYRKKLNEWRENRQNIRKQRLPGEKNGDNRSIKDFNNMSKKNDMAFELIGVENISYQSLWLVRRMGMTNMVLLESLHGEEIYGAEKIPTGCKGETMEPYIPKKYRTIQEYLERFVKIRLYYYQLRKNHLIAAKERDLATHVAKRRFIADVVDKVIDVFHTGEESLLSLMKERGHAESLLSTTPIRKFCPEEVERLSQAVQAIEEELATLRGTSPRDMWLRDLEEFEKVYTKHYKGEGSQKQTASRKHRLVRVKKDTPVHDDAMDLIRQRDYEAPSRDDDDVEGTNSGEDGGSSNGDM